MAAPLERLTMYNLPDRLLVAIGVASSVELLF
jgi:hypothetical protein